MRLLIDENLRRSTVPALTSLGHDAEDVRVVGLRGADDQTIFAYATRTERILITRDLDFANTLDYPLGGHAGIVVLRVPDTLKPAAIIAILTGALARLTEDLIRGALIIIEGSRVRRRTANGSAE